MGGQLIFIVQLTLGFGLLTFQRTALSKRGRFQVGQIGDHSAVRELHSKGWTRP